MPLDPTLATLGFDEGIADQLAPVPPGVEPARAIEVRRGFVRVRAASGEWLSPIPPALRHGSERWPVPGPPVTGDWLAVETEGPVAGIVPRRSALRRHDETAGDEVLVANADLVLVVSSLNQDLNPGRLERLLAIAHEGDLPAVLALSKSDLRADPAREARQMSAALGVEAIPFSSRTGAGLEALRAAVRPRATTVLIGSSGVGKSTLVNTLLGEALQRTLEIRESDDQGRHATTSRTLLELPGGALIVDTPGLRSPRPCGRDGLPTTFADVFELAAQCRFADCSHDAEPGCEVRDAIESGELPARRVESLRKLEGELQAAEERSAPAGPSGRRVREKAADRAYRRDPDDD